MLENLGVLNAPAFALASLLIVLCPGPNSLFVLRTSLSSGARVAFCAACGVFLGDSVLMLATYLGVAAIILAHPMLFTILKCAGAAYLTYLSVGILWRVFRARKNPPQTDGTAHTPVKPVGISPVKAFRTALMLSLSNPKAMLFMFSFFLPFIDPSKGHPGLAFLVLALIMQCWSVGYLSNLCHTGTLLLRFFGRRPALGKLGNVLLSGVFLVFSYELVMA